jgi:hypothetical protein
LNTNATGVNVDGRWLKVSKFHPVDLSARGTRNRPGRRAAIKGLLTRHLD